MLGLFVDGKRIYTIGGTLQKTKIMYETKHPAILPNDEECYNTNYRKCS